MTEPGDNPFGKPSDIGDEVGDFLAGMAQNDVKQELPQEEVEYRRQQRLAERQAVEIFGRHGFELTVPDGQTIQDAGMSFYDQISQLEERFQAYADENEARFSEDPKEMERLDAEMNATDATFQTELADVERAAEACYVADNVAVYILDRLQQGRGDVALGGDIIAKIVVSEHLDNEQKQRMLEAAREAIGEDEFAAAEAYVTDEGLAAQLAAERTLVAAQDAQRYEELRVIEDYLATIADPNSPRLEEWPSLAGDVQLARDIREKADAQVGREFEGLYKNSLAGPAKRLRQKASRLGINAESFEQFLVQLGIDGKQKPAE